MKWQKIYEWSEIIEKSVYIQKIMFLKSCEKFIQKKFVWITKISMKYEKSDEWP